MPGYFLGRGGMGGLMGGGGAPWYIVPGKTCARAYQANGAASLAASYVNLASPGTGDASAISAPTWNATDGWIYDGLANCLNSGLVPTATTTVMIQYADGTNAGVICGSFVTTTDSVYWIIPRISSNDKVRYAYGSAPGPTTDVAPKQDTGVLGIAGGYGYRNGVVDTTAMSGFVSSTKAIYIGGWNNNGTAAAFWAGKIKKFAAYADALTGPEMLALYNRMVAI